MDFSRWKRLHPLLVVCLWIAGFSLKVERMLSGFNDSIKAASRRYGSLTLVRDITITIWDYIYNTCKISKILFNTTDAAAAESS